MLTKNFSLCILLSLLARTDCLSTRFPLTIQSPNITSIFDINSSKINFEYKFEREFFLQSHEKNTSLVKCYFGEYDLLYCSPKKIVRKSLVYDIIYQVDYNQLVEKNKDLQIYVEIAIDSDDRMNNFIGYCIFAIIFHVFLIVGFYFLNIIIDCLGIQSYIFIESNMFQISIYDYMIIGLLILNVLGIFDINHVDSFGYVVPIRR
jgi:hypothetical protein